MVQDQIPERDVEQTEAHDDQSHHGAAAESDLQSAVKRLPGGIGRTGRGIGRGLHAEEAGQAREETARKEGEGNPRVLHAGTVGQVGEEERQQDEDHQHDVVLLFEVGHGSLADVRGNLAHAFRALVFPLHERIKNPRHGQRHDRGRRHQPENRRSVHFGRYGF